ncbi:hypothetical protein Q428_01890 [Fervidicella metallireducens AeB]|uniref:Alkaline shock protein n=1 Tax=Fervidicella metallireducens AeB TaxID=1403537 RepID=A0A017RXT7_9CLOT|nr:hypothetical protein [Fervidicella metallireducens]EYE89553.1 hypothetical protein Q428_01890 [Fervidicella metallireducens AeB]
MEIFALVGRSGTGKSYKALNVAGIYNIQYIIDDGILIMGNKILAGVSAKRENTKIAAVKRAIFLNEQHRLEVLNALKQHNPDKLLIIGTSENMIHNIMKNLKLGNSYNLIRIEDVSSYEEIEAAKKARKQKGKHVIPVPTFEVKKQFSGYVLDSIRHLVFKNNKEFETYEKTVVRPTFSYLGKYDITPSVIKKIAMISALEVEGVAKVHGVGIENKENGTIVTVEVTLMICDLLYKICASAAKRVKDNLEYMTNINILEVNISVKDIDLNKTSGIDALAFLFSK